MRFVVLAEPNDAGARAVAAELIRRHGPEATVVASSADLAQAVWAHRIDEHGVTTRITLSDGVVVDDRAAPAILNRLAALASALPDDTDRNFAAMEWTALAWSWLASLGSRVVDCAGITRSRESPAVRLVRAAREGLPTRGFRVTTNARSGRRPWDVLLRAGGRFSAHSGVVPVGRTPALFLEPAIPSRPELEAGETIREIAWATRGLDGGRVVAAIETNPSLATPGDVRKIVARLERAASEAP